MSSEQVRRAKRQRQYIPNSPPRGCLECGHCENCIDRSIAEWERHNRDQAEMGQQYEPEAPMTKREINLWAIRHGISLSPEEAESAVANGNQDPGEGVEWLPYYKASLGNLAELVGLLSGLIQRHRVSISDETLAAAKRLWLLHLHFGGIGPDEDIERGQRLKKQAEEQAEECFAALAAAVNQ